jgi:hypothetical protein
VLIEGCIGLHRSVRCKSRPTNPKLLRSNPVHWSRVGPTWRRCSGHSPYP